MSSEKKNEGFQIDQKINGKFVIEKFLGGGGMGLVYLAYDDNDLNRKVVIKTLKSDAIENKYTLKHFYQEAEALGRINYDGVVKIIDHGKDDKSSLPFLVMEFADGQTLTEIIKRGPMEVKKCADLVKKIALALNAAHKVKVYHRDLKPDNIIVIESQDEPDRIKLIDFGIAKVKESKVGPSTTVQILAGTLEYASPEQLNGEQSIQGEVFCLATLAYQMLTQHLAFPLSAYKEKPENLIKIRDKLLELHKRGIKAPKFYRQDLPSGVENVFRKGLEIDPDKRYKSPLEFANAFASALDNKAHISSPVIYDLPPRRKPIGRFVLLTIAVIGLIWLLYYILKPG